MSPFVGKNGHEKEERGIKIVHEGGASPAHLSSFSGSRALVQELYIVGAGLWDQKGGRKRAVTQAKVVYAVNPTMMQEQSLMAPAHLERQNDRANVCTPFGHQIAGLPCQAMSHVEDWRNYILICTS